jgi:hypothetical protein
MVTPIPTRLSFVDVPGAAVCGVCLLGCAYLVLFHSGHANLETAELTSLMNTATQDLSTVRAARDRQRAMVAERQTDLASGKYLPASLPIEEYFQTLSRLAHEHRLRVVRQNPLSPREYPGLLEQRYAYEVSGAMPDMARFFKAVEDADIWADIAYLKIETAEKDPQRVSSDRLAVLTISLFSALKQENPPSGG